MNDFINSLRPYCEPVLHSGIEPLNTVSNIGFIIVALWIFRTAKSKSSLIIGFFSLLLGVGSGLWHAFRGVPTYFADTVPLALLLITSIYCLLRTQGKIVPLIGFISIILLYCILEFGFSLADPGLSEIYLSVILVFFGFIALHYIKQKPGIRELTGAGLLFAVGYAIRQLDQFYCEHAFFHHGTHWMWHLFCAGAVYFVVKYMERSQNKSPHFWRL